MTQFQTMLLSLTNKLESNKVSQPFLKLNSLNNLFENKKNKTTNMHILYARIRANPHQSTYRAAM